MADSHRATLACGDRIYRFAPKEELAKYLADGWQESARPLGWCHHGQYSVLVWREEYAD
jgi:hypothetical protein